MLNRFSAIGAFILISLLAEPLQAQPVSETQFCAQVKQEVQAVDPALATRTRSFNAGEELIAIKPSKDREQVLVSDGVARWWIPRGAIKLTKQSECHLTPTESPTATKPWSWFVDVGAGGELATSAYSQFITEVPDPNQVEGLQDPIILKVEPGSSTRFGFGVLIPQSEKLRWRGAISYQQLSFSMQAKVNPADSSPIRLYERADTTVEFTQQLWSVEGGVDYDLPFALHDSVKWFVGLSATLNYFPEAAEVVVRTGTIFKATETKLTGGPEGIDLGLSASTGIVAWEHVRVQFELTQEAAWGVRAGYQWQF